MDGQERRWLAAYLKKCLETQKREGENDKGNDRTGIKIQR